jgi:outer membrane protein assembly factor BamB
MANPSQKGHRINKGIIFSAFLIVAVLLTAFLINSYKPPAVQETSTDKPFKLDLQHFANTIAVDGGKYFVLDDYANLTCFDAYNGSLIWQTNIGDWRSGGILIKDGVIYAGSALSVVQAVDEATGVLLKTYVGLHNPFGGYKGPAEAYFVEDGRIVIQEYGCNAYNIATAKSLWSDESVPKYEPTAIPYTNTIWAFPGNIVAGEGYYHIDNQLENGIYRMDPDKGTIMWQIEGFVDQKTLLYQDKIILSGFGQGVNGVHNSIIALNAATGTKEWSYNVGSSINTPTIVGDRLLFVAQDGYIYALNLSDGSLAWKTALTGKLSSQTGMSVVTVDVENQEVYWAYSAPGKNATTYESTLYRLNLSSGQNLAKTVFQGSGGGSFYREDNPSIGLALLKNSAVLTINRDLWFFSRTDLTSVKMEHFDHTLCKLIAAYGHVYVAADLYAMRYEDIK